MPRLALRRQVFAPASRRRWLLGLGALALTSQPLVGTLGYESSLVLTLPLGLLGVAVGVDAVRKLRLDDAGDPVALSLKTGGDHLRALLARGLPELLLLLAIALGALVLGMAWQINCDPWTGLLWFLLLPTASGALGLVAGLWGGALAEARGRQLLLGGVPVLFCLLVALVRAYRDPAVFALDPFFGYFAGPIYDEAIPITARLLWFRAYNFLIAGAALAALALSLQPGALARPRLAAARRAPWTALALLACLAPGLWLGLRAPAMGFHATADSLAHALPGLRVTEHFVLHYAPAGATARDIDLVAAEHEFAWHRLEKAIGRAPAVPVHSFVFPSPESKRALLGAGNTEVAPPWRGHIYLNEQPFPHRVMHHELAHAFSYTVGEQLFGTSSRLGLGGLRVNLALVEGFATALAPRAEGALDLHDQAAILDRVALRPELAEIMGVGFWGKAGRRAYTAAGSFSLWLLETRGVGPFLALYGSAGDFDAAYGAPLSALESEWLAFLRARPVAEKDVEALRQRFKQRAIFQRPCAHRAADLLSEAAQAQLRGDAALRLDALRTLCEIEPEQPEHRVVLALAEAQIGLLAEAAGTLAGVAQVPDLTDTIAALVDERRGDLALARGDLAAAEAFYTLALGRGLTEAQVRQLQLKQRGAADPALAPRLLAYFDPFEPSPEHPFEAVLRLHAAQQVAALPGHATIGGYLVARQLLNVQQGEAALEALRRALQPEPGDAPLGSPELVRGARLMLLEAQTRSRAYDDAAATLAELMGDPTIGSGHRLEFALWAERLAFFREHLP